MFLKGFNTSKSVSKVKVMNKKNSTIQSVLKNKFAVSCLQFSMCIFLQTATYLLPTLSFSQCSPMIKIDGNNIITDENHPAGLKLPSWLRNPQTLEKGQYVFSISVIEFTMNGTALDYSQNISVTTVQTVPVGKVWKIESIHKDATMSQGFTTLYSTPGAFTFIPACSGTYAVKVWGGGGGGSGGNTSICAGGGGGGGGSGYSEGSFFLIGGSSYAVTVGSGGVGGSNNANGTNGASSSVGTIGMSATGGTGGLTGTPGTGGAGGTGSGGQINYTGQAGANGNSTINSSPGNGGTAGGSSNPGGAGGVNGGNGSTGLSPGGGGGGAAYYNSSCGGAGGTGGAGANGMVEFSTASSANIMLTPKVPCVVLYLYGGTNCNSYSSPVACPSGWIDGGCGPSLFSGFGVSYCRTCYRCE